MNIFVVIAVHNRKTHTLNCLSQLSKQTLKSFQVILVDDGSTDGTSDAVLNLYPDTHIITGTGEWWWTKSMNEGFRYAITKNADLIVTLNNDTIFANNLLEELYQLHKKHPGAIIGCINTVKKEDEYIFFSGIKKISWWKAKEVKYHNSFEPFDHRLTGLHPTECLNGRGTLIPTAVFKAIGYFDEHSLPQYASDYDFTLRAGKAGIKVLISWDIKVQSILESTGKGRSFINQSLFSYLRSMADSHSSSSLHTVWTYYSKHAGWQLWSGVPAQYARLLYSFFKKRNVMEDLK